MRGHTYQLHSTAFRVDTWSGESLTVTDETTDSGFFPLQALPDPLSASVPETLGDLASYEGDRRLRDQVGRGSPYHPG